MVTEMVYVIILKNVQNLEVQFDMIELNLSIIRDQLSHKYNRSLFVKLLFNSSTWF